MSRRNDLFASVKTEGALLTSDLLKRVAEGSREVEGIKPADYHLPDNERISTAVSRAWTRLRTAWTAFKAAKAGLGADDVATGLTREKWLLQVFQALEYGRLQAAKGVKVAGKEYPISHMWRNTPIHLVGFGVDLDHRQKGVVGAAKISPHGLIQDYLNQEPAALWGFVSNGLNLRLLRDNVSMTRQAYVEFDLESMFEGDLYSDFHLLWMLCHQSRVEAEKPEECWLEKWSTQSREQGIRVLDTLRDGVQKALEIFGQGFLAHPENNKLRERLRDGRLDKQDYYRQLLRLVYRLLFLFVAEDRQLLLDPQSGEKAKSRYREFYSMARLRLLAGQIVGSKHGDLYRGLVLLMGLLHEKGCKDIGVPALNSFLWSIEAVKDIWDCELSNRDLLKVIRSLAYTQKAKVLMPVDYRNMGAEELGSVYESLLELQPKIDTDNRNFELVNLKGSERKSSGSYYTPTGLINLLLKSALDPVLEQAAMKDKPEQAILNLKICDPSCGSGHFLVAAAYRVAKKLAMVRTGDIEPSPEAVRHSLRDVIGHCIYGVDLNEMAVELCKVSLWMEGMEPGKPLSFLEHRIQCGNSLVGAVPSLLAKGVPDEAFEALEGDDKKLVSALKKRNKQEREYGQTTLEFSMGANENTGNLSDLMEQIASISDETVENIQDKSKRYQSYRSSRTYQHAQGVADAWCSTFLCEKNDEHPDSVTHDLFKKLQSNSQLMTSPVIKEAMSIARENKCFHWHLSFPDVFKVRAGNEGSWGWAGGFDVMLGNPPWERPKIQEIEWFSQYDPDIALAENASIRKKKIEALAKHNPHLLKRFRSAQHQAEGWVHFLLDSGKYPLAGRGDVNTYSVFSESFFRLISENGKAGFIVPSGIASDATTRFLLQEFVNTDRLVSLLSYENEEFIFPAIHHATKFCLLTVSGSGVLGRKTEYVFFARQIEQVNEEERKYHLDKNDLGKVNPNTMTVPAYRCKRDAEICKAIYSRVPILIKEEVEEELNPWGVKYAALFHMANDSHLFVSREELEAKGFQLVGNYFKKGSETFVPLYEGKMFWHFDHRFGTYEGQTQAQANQGKLPELTDEQHSDPDYLTMPYYWVNTKTVEETRQRKSLPNWTITFRDITSAVVARTVISTILPFSAVGHAAPMLSFADVVTPNLVNCFLANMNSIVLDYVSRTKVGGGHLTFFILKQFPMFTPDMVKEECSWNKKETYEAWISQRVVELVYTANDLKHYANDYGYKGTPFKWDAARRELLRSELDAAFFHLYGIGREDANYILDTFRIIRERDEKKYGEYRTKRLILEKYDELAGRPVEVAVPEAQNKSVVHMPFEKVSRPLKGERYGNCVPLLTLQAAAGGFSDEQPVEFDSWVRIKTQQKLSRGMFVAQAVGKSMEPGVPDGSYCLFRYIPAGTRQDKIVLVQHHDIADPDTGGSYSIKRFTSKKKRVEDHWEHAEIRLLSGNPAYPPIVLNPNTEGELKVIAEFIEILK